MIADVTDEGGGERMKPPDCAGGVDMVVLVWKRRRIWAARSQLTTRLGLKLTDELEKSAVHFT